jgi:hypothetical protein
MSRAKQRSNVEDMSNPNYRQIHLGRVHQEVDHKFISLGHKGFSTQGQVFVRKDGEMGEI